MAIKPRAVWIHRTHAIDSDPDEEVTMLLRSYFMLTGDLDLSATTPNEGE